ncbi:MAG: ParB/RepB/Spo0J family partition protein [Methylococcales bacterium]|nr:ParB/RepB/Spo0J family partition protein [Methylococcales bacterium]
MATKKRGLHRGLDALLGDVVQQTQAPVSQQGVQQLPVEWLKRGRYQPRKDIDPGKIQELAESIKAQGIIQPIIVRKLEEQHYEIIAGERRWRAAQLAQLSDVPVLVRELDDRTALAIALIENIQREDLSPLEEADALQRLLDEFGMTQQSLGAAVGKSRAQVANLLRLLDLEAEVKALLNNKELDMGHARALLALPGNLQVQAARKVAQQGLTVRATESLVKALLQPKHPTAQTANHDADTQRLIDRLTDRLGADVMLNHQPSGAGKLVVNYRSVDQLEGILQVLGVSDEDEI